MHTHPIVTKSEWLEARRALLAKEKAHTRAPVLGGKVKHFDAAAAGRVPGVIKIMQMPTIEAAAVFKQHGALRVVECWGDDVPEGKITSFPMAVKRKDDETVVFSWITWPSKQVRDEGMKKVMADPRTQPDRNPMPFDGKRLIYGGFEVLLDA